MFFKISIEITIRICQFKLNFNIILFYNFKLIIKNINLFIKQRLIFLYVKKIFSVVVNSMFSKRSTIIISPM